MGVNGIYGLSGSGLDIESLVKVGMLNKQHQYDKMQQAETKNLWEKEEWSTIYDKLQTYKYDDLSTYKMQSNMNAHKATSSDTSIVTATANGAAASMTHQVKVSAVASNAYLLTGDGKGVTRTNTKAPASNYLGDVIFSSSASTTVGDKKYYTINGDTSKAYAEDDIAVSMEIVDSINSDGSYNTKKLEYTYKDIFENEKTLYDFATDLGRVGATVQGNYDSVNNSFSIYNNNSGSSNVLGLHAGNDAAAILLNNLNLSSYNSNTGELTPASPFIPDNKVPTTMESGEIKREVVSTSLKDVLGISAAKNADGDYEIKDSKGTLLTKLSSVSDFENTVAFSLNLSDGTNSSKVDFSYADLFKTDGIGSRTSLKSNMDLSALADKINTSGLNLSAGYDAKEDSFSLAGTKDFTKAPAISGTGTMGTQLVSSLNLGEVTEGKYTQITGLDPTADLTTALGLSAKISINTGDSTQAILSVKQGSSTVSAYPSSGYITTTNFYIANGSTGEGSVAAMQNAVSISLSNGTDSATVAEFNNGDLFDFNNIKKSTTTDYIVYKGTELNRFLPPCNMATSSKKTVQDLIDGITSANGVNGISATYSNGTLTLVNAGGEAKLEANNALNNLTMTSGDVTSLKSSKKITRVNATSTDDDSVTGVLGISVAKDGSNYVLTNKDGSTETITDGSKTAFTLKVTAGDSGDTDVAISYAELAAGMDLDALAGKISSATGSAVTAKYNDGKFILDNKNGTVNIVASDTDALGKSMVANLGLKENDSSIGNKVQARGTDAEVTIDGKNYTLDKNSKTVAGVTYTFTGKTEGTNPVNVTVTQDTDKIIDYVKGFVEGYNALIDYMNDKLSEPLYSDFKPLTSTQEEQMTEKQIEKWTEKAKSGILYHNNNLRSIVNNMREAIYTPVDAVESIYNSASAIGITSSNVKGHLKLDEDKLKQALAADPDCVYQIFASDQDSAYIPGTTKTNKLTNSQKKLDFNNTGLANRLYNIMTDSMNKVEDYAGTSKESDDQSYLGKLITSLQTKMSTFKTHMNAYETLLYKKYDSMESALARLGAQLNYVSNYGG